MLFRYPGGKAKLADQILNLLDFQGGTYAEPFLGGGSVAITLAKRLRDKPILPQVTKFMLNDLDPHMYAFWHVALYDSDTYFYQLVEKMKTQPTIEMFNSMKKETPSGLVDKAYHAMFFNHTTFSGILTSGPIGGYDQKNKWKVDVRWNSNRLIKELKECRKLFYGKTEVYSLDFRKFLELVPVDATIYADPPYYDQGNALYAICKEKEHRWEPSTHEALRDILSGRAQNWVLSYDNCKEVKELYKDFTINDEVKAYHSITDKKERPTGTGKELLITP